MSWPVATIGEVCAVVSGATPRTANSSYWDEGDIPWVTPKDLSELNQKYLSDTSRKITKAGLRSCSAKMLPPQSVLLSSRAPIGLVALNTMPVCTNQGFKSLVPQDGRVSPDYLYWWLISHRRAIEQRGRGATFKEVSKKIVTEIAIPLPPLAEQKRIAAILDAADALRAKRRETLAQLDTLLQSTFLDMFGDPVTNPMGWDIKPLDEIGKVQTGATPPSKLNGMFGGRIPFVTPNDLKDTWVDASRTVTPEGAAKSRTVCAGSTLVSCIGAIGKMGKARNLSAFNQQINAVSWKKCVADSAFGLEVMRFFKGRLAHSATATTVPILKKSRFEKLLLPLPPLPLQHRFATIATSIEAQKSRHRAHLAELDTLFASLQSRAFTGDL